MAHSHHKIFDFALGLSALGAASGIRGMATAQQANAVAALAATEIAAVDALNRAVATGLVPPPPKPPTGPTGGLWSAARTQYKQDMQQYQADLAHWHQVVHMTLHPAKPSSGRALLWFILLVLFVTVFVVQVVASHS